MPDRASFGDVRKVVAEYFPPPQSRKAGKEAIVISHCWLAALTRFPHGNLSIGTVKGRHVKDWQIDDLVYAIGFAEWLRSRGWPEDRPINRSIGEAYERENG